MKKTLTLFVSIILLSSTFAQFQQLRQDEGLLSGGMGMLWIDGQPHYAVRLQPEIAFANIGIETSTRLVTSRS